MMPSRLDSGCQKGVLDGNMTQYSDLKGELRESDRLPAVMVTG
jgi:hypothetical protein